MTPDIGIIGGADGPTSVLLTGGTIFAAIIGVAIVVAIVTAVVVSVIFSTRQ